MAEAGTAQVSGDQAFTRSAGKQLGLYAFYTLLAMSVLLYLLSVAAGSTASGLGSGAINIESNSITITLREEPPQLNASRATDASSFVVLAHVQSTPELIKLKDVDRKVACHLYA
ncbi:MAG TPA: hypothetical protein DCS89_10125 [Gammaproteobacteria bacterium]|nr:hypothetical protein [Gammaproteobacteria bacterium]HAT27362.1 hypothetical protein [Gammaproteobacteria bacterium]|tara:strand:- start:1937 stop:2281 length:345 start_codon:yes stop_codon:yes gene_type:complete